MQAIPVQSTTLAAVAYDPAQHLLQLEFRDRTIYHYRDVPPDVHDALLRAPSKGAYFNRVIRPQYAYVPTSNGKLT
jgi:KTSC domain